MLTLVKEKNANAIVPIVSTEGKARARPIATVYFTHSLKDDNKNDAPCAPTLTLHRSHIKKVNQISEHEYNAICNMIDTGEEPEVGHPLRKAYWDVRDRYETSLMREMYIGDQSDIKFQLDFPKAVKDWPGTMTLFGSSGAGKTYFLVAMIERYLKAVSAGSSIRPIIWLSPEEKIDKTLAPLKKPRWNHLPRHLHLREGRQGVQAGRRGVLQEARAIRHREARRERADRL